MKKLKAIMDRIIGPPQKKQQVSKFFSVGPDDYKTLPRGYQKQTGILKARLDRLTEEYEKARSENQELKKALTDLTQEKVMSAPFISKKEQISMARLFLATMSRKQATKLLLEKPGVIKVVTREHRYLGTFHDLWFEVVGNKLLWKIIVNREGKLRVAMKGFSFTGMVHRPVGLVDALRSSVLVLNRTYDGKFVPDVEWIEYGGESQDIEDMMGQLEEKIASLEGELVQARTNEEKERTKRKLDRVGAESEKARADALADHVTNELESVKAMAQTFGKMAEQLGESNTSANILRQKIEKMESVVEEVQDKLEKRLPEDKVEHVMQQTKELMQFLGEMREDMKPEGKK